MTDHPAISERPEDQVSIRSLRAVNTLFARVYHNLTILTPPTLPRHGPGILVCNHISSIDPLLIQSACTHRLINWMMASEYMDLPYMRKVFQTLEVIPVDRGKKETGPMRTVFRKLAAGRIIGIFPEGKISTAGELLEFQTGVALIAIRAKVPIHPVYLEGSQRNKGMEQAFFDRSKSVVTFGPALKFAASDTSKKSVDLAMLEIVSAIKKLKKDVDDYQAMR